jgi:hypothetical protein
MAFITRSAISWPSLKLKHDSYVQGFYWAATQFVTELYGPRCTEFDPDCECCRRWKLLDDLVENPFIEQS